MKSKATHKGECQLCGKVQMLPNDRLSIHGYSVTWNQFVGQCPGSEYLPYEMSCNLLIDKIPSLSITIDSIQKDIASLLLRNGDTGFFLNYDKTSGKYIWEEVDYSLFTESRKLRYRLHENAESEARNGDREYIRQYLSPHLQGLKQYQKWCQERVDNWQEKALTKREQE